MSISLLTGHTSALTKQFVSEDLPVFGAPITATCKLLLDDVRSLCLWEPVLGTLCVASLLEEAAEDANRTNAQGTRFKMMMEYDEIITKTS